MKFSWKIVGVAGFILASVGMLAFGALVVVRLLAAPQPLSVMAASKITAKQIVRRVKAIVYRGATMYNPSGDTLPDAWDDIILGKIKQWL